jgi:tRNA (mo5U34)-methyltransferase
MRNVWFLPTVAELDNWLHRSGFTNVRCVDVTKTTVEEQRSTDWMRFESLQEALDPDNPDLTVEGWPAPQRAIFLANTR